MKIVNYTFLTIALVYRSSGILAAPVGFVPRDVEPNLDARALGIAVQRLSARESPLIIRTYHDGLNVRNLDYGTMDGPVFPREPSPRNKGRVRNRPPGTPQGQQRQGNQAEHVTGQRPQGSIPNNRYDDHHQLPNQAGHPGQHPQGSIPNNHHDDDHQLHKQAEHTPGQHLQGSIPDDHHYDHQLQQEDDYGQHKEAKSAGASLGDAGAILLGSTAARVVTNRVSSLKFKGSRSSEPSSVDPSMGQSDVD